MNIFEKATKNKLRFSFRGQISTEDLWDLNLASLDEIYRAVNNQLKKATEVSLLQKRTEANETLELQASIVKYIFEIKQQEDDQRKQQAEKVIKQKRIMDIIAQKQDAGLQEKSLEELQEMLKNM